MLGYGLISASKFGLEGAGWLLIAVKETLGGRQHHDEATHDVTP